jgi:hypothetical protein
VLRRNVALALTLAFAASLMLASGAAAKDRNHDRIHGLSLKHKQGKRDQDHDGLRNRGEWRAKLDPRDADSDDDGVDDGEENTGKVEAFEDGVLTISLFNGDTIEGAVDDSTDIKCDDEPSDDRHGHGDHDGHHGDDDHGDDDARSARHGDDDDDRGCGDCGPEALVAGAKVLEAELEIRHGEAVWDEVELLKTP